MYVSHQKATKSVKSKRPAKQSQKPDQTRVTCHNCGKAGHMIKDCWSKGGGKEGQGPKSKNKSPATDSTAYKAASADDFETSYTAIVEDALLITATKYDWIADTGSTAHIAPVREMFTDYVPSTGDSIVRGVGNTETKVAGRGTIRLLLDLGNGATSKHTLQNVLHIPSATTCLLSVSKFVQTDGYASFTKSGLHLLNKDGLLLGRGVLERGLYVLQARASLTSNYALLGRSDPGASWDEWHRHFGHIRISGLKELHSKGMVTGFNVDGSSTASHDCDACIAAKMARRST